MESALSLFEASPTAGSYVLADADRARAGLAAERDVILVEQGVIGHLVCPDVVPYLIFGPAHQRVYFDQPKSLIPLDSIGFTAIGRLISPDAGDPSPLAR